MTDRTEENTEKSPGLHFTEDQTPDNGTTSQDPKIGEKKNKPASNIGISPNFHSCYVQTEAAEL